MTRQTLDNSKMNGVPLATLLRARIVPGLDVQHTYTWTSVASYSFNSADRIVSTTTLSCMAKPDTIAVFGQGDADGPKDGSEVRNALVHAVERTLVRRLLEQAERYQGSGLYSAGGAHLCDLATEMGQNPLQALDNLLINAYLSSRADPGILVMSGSLQRTLTRWMKQIGTTTVRLNGPDASSTEPALITSIFNSNTGHEMRIMLSDAMPDDTLMALPIGMPYPALDSIDPIDPIDPIVYEYTVPAWRRDDHNNVWVLESTLLVKTYFIGSVCVLRGIRPAES